MSCPANADWSDCDCENCKINREFEDSPSLEVWLLWYVVIWILIVSLIIIFFKIECF